MGIIEESTELEMAKAVCKKISHQAPNGNESALIFAVFRQAVLDCYYMGMPVRDSHEARSYLRRNTVPTLEVLGVDTDWARDLFKKANTVAMQ